MQSDSSQKTPRSSIYDECYGPLTKRKDLIPQVRTVAKPAPRNDKAAQQPSQEENPMEWFAKEVRALKAGKR